MKKPLAELDEVEVIRDQACGLVQGARGTAMAFAGGFCTVEILDRLGYTIGLFEVPIDDLRPAEYTELDEILARED